MTTTLLLIDDDQNNVSTLKEGLEISGYRVLTATDGVTGLALAQIEAPDLVLLDLTIPGFDGYTVCKRLRQSSDVPIIIISDLHDEMHAIASFELGANDFVPRHIQSGELFARIRSHLRWSVREVRQTVPPAKEGSLIEIGELRIDPEGHRVWQQEQEITMTLKEFELLLYLVEHSDKVLTREQLMDQVWSSVSQSTLRTIDVHIHSLRDKIEKDPAHPHLIETVRGVGYRFHAS